MRYLVIVLLMFMVSCSSTKATKVEPVPKRSKNPTEKYFQRKRMSLRTGLC